MKDFLIRVEKSAVAAAKDSLYSMEENISLWKSEQKGSQFLNSEKLVLYKLGAEEILEALKSFLVIYAYALKIYRVQKLFFHACCNCNYPSSLLIGARLLQRLLDKDIRGNVQKS